MLRHLARVARRAAHVPRYYGGGLVSFAASHPVFLWAQAIAFKVFVTLLPLILLATGIFGLVLRQPDPFGTVAAFLRSFLPVGVSGPLVELVYALQAASGALTAVGAGALLVTVITLFTTLRIVVGQAMGTTRHTMRTPLRGYAFDVRMMAQAGSLFLLSFGVTVLSNAALSRTGLVATALGLDADVLSAIARAGVRALGLAVPYVLTLGMLWQLYHFVPRPRTPKRSALVGAAVAAVLFELAKNGFALYARYVGDFDRYADASVDGLGGLGGVFGLILAFVFWVYLSGLILIIGAIVTSLHEKQLRPRRAALRRLWAQVGVRRPGRVAGHPASDEAGDEADGEAGDEAGDDAPDTSPDGAAAPAAPAS